jgi:hypothetical protein
MSLSTNTWLEGLRRGDPSQTPFIPTGVYQLTSSDGSIDIDMTNPYIPDIRTKGGGGGGGIEYVAHDNTLSGMGTEASPLSVVSSGSGVQSITAGAYIDITGTPQNPVINVDLPVVNTNGWEFITSSRLLQTIVGIDKIHEYQIRDDVKNTVMVGGRSNHVSISSLGQNDRYGYRISVSDSRIKFIYTEDWLTELDTDAMISSLDQFMIPNPVQQVIFQPPVHCTYIDIGGSPVLTSVAVDGITITGDGTAANPLTATGGGGGGGDYWEAVGTTSIRPIAPYNRITTNMVEAQRLTIPGSVDGTVSDITQLDRNSITTDVRHIPSSQAVSDALKTISNAIASKANKFTIQVSRHKTFADLQIGMNLSGALLNLPGSPSTWTHDSSNPGVNWQMYVEFNNNANTFLVVDYNIQTDGSGDYMAFQDVDSSGNPTPLYYLYRGDQQLWVGPTFPMPGGQDYVITNLAAQFTTDPNTSNINWDYTEDIVMDLEQVYDIAVSGGGTPIIDPHWEVNANNQLTTTTPGQAVLVDSFTATNTIDAYGSIWSGSGISCSGGISAGGSISTTGYEAKIFTTGRYASIYTTGENATIFTQTDSSDIYTMSDYSGIYTTNAAIMAQGALGSISASQGITAGGKISTTSTDIDSIYTTGSITVDGGVYLTACTHSWDDAGINLQEQRLYCGGVVLTGGTDSEFRGQMDYYSNLNLHNSAIVITDQWGTRTITSQPGSHTITHYTNIVDYDDSKIGCFCETTGELADVYDKDGVAYTPTLSRATDAITKVKSTNMLSTRVLGIITSQNTYASHGDVLVVVKQGPSYQLGQLLVPDISGVCRIATEEDKRTIMFEGLPRVRITGLVQGQEFVLAFMS